MLITGAAGLGGDEITTATGALPASAGAAEQQASAGAGAAPTGAAGTSGFRLKLSGNVPTCFVSADSGPVELR